MCDNQIFSEIFVCLKDVCVGLTTKHNANRTSDNEFIDCQ